MFFCVEDELSKAKCKKLLILYAQPQFIKELNPQQGGNGAIRKRICEYVKLAAHYPVFILTDLDSIECAPALRDDLIGQIRGRRPIPEQFLLRVVVREAEAWLLADRQNFSDFLGIDANILPDDVEADLDPKKTLLNAAKRCSKHVLKQDLLPKGRGAKIGLGYNRALSSFVESSWDPEAAAGRSDSLRRTIDRLGQI